MDSLNENVLKNKLMYKRKFNYMLFKILDEYLVWIFTLIIFISMSIIMRDFLKPQVIISIIVNAVPLGITVIAVTLPLLLRKFDLSIESTLGFTALIGALLITKTGMNPYIAIIVVFITGGAIGFFNGICIVKLGVEPFMQTLSVYLALKGLMLLITSGVAIGITSNSYRIFGNTEIFGIPTQIYILIILYIFFIIILEQSVFGRRIYAIGSSPKLAFESGIKSDKIQIIVFTISGLLASMAGLIVSSKMGAVEKNLGSGMLFYMFAAAVLGGVGFSGGKGKIIGGLGGTIFLATIASLLSWFKVSAYIIDVTRGFIILFAILLDSLKNYIKDKVFS